MRNLELRPMRIRLSDPKLLPELRQHFTRAGFAVEQTAADSVDVRRADAPSHEQARREIAPHLKLWRAMYSEVRIEEEGVD